MEDQDRETRIEEDVEGHAHKMRNAGKAIGKEEGDDVEGHAHKMRNPAADDESGDDVEAHSHKMRNVTKDDEADDVEAHVHKANVNLGQHKA